MATVMDVASYILRAQGPMSAFKLQKLTYYSQAWHLVWMEEPLYTSRIEAWVNGPVTVELYDRHRRRFRVNAELIGGDPDALTPAERGTIDTVLEQYGRLSGHELSELTHREPPWRLAREEDGLKPLQRGHAEITWAAMAEYYDSLTTATLEDLEDEQDLQAVQDLKARKSGKTLTHEEMLQKYAEDLRSFPEEHPA